MSQWQAAYRIGDSALALQGASPALEAWAASLYPCARSEERAEDARALYLAGQEGAYGIWEGGEQVALAATQRAFFIELEWRMTRALMEGLAHRYQLHAGVVVRNGGALVVCGASGAGKTSLCVALGLRGAAVYSDEVAAFDMDALRVEPFPRDLIVHAGTQSLFPELASISVPPWKSFADRKHLPPRGWCASAEGAVPCRARLFTRLPGSGPSALRPLGQAEAAQRILEQSFNVAQWEQRAIDAVAALVENHPAWELVFADARGAADHLLASEIVW